MAARRRAGEHRFSPEDLAAGPAPTPRPGHRRRRRIPPLDRDLVGTDVAYVSPELAAATPESQAVFQGAPTLVAEVLSPSDKQQDVEDKIAAYLAADVPHIWIVTPRFRTVTVYRPGSTPRVYGVEDEIDAEPHLPGFRAAVATIFED